MNEVFFDKMSPIYLCNYYWVWVKNETKKKSFVKTFNRENVRLKLKQNINC